MTHGIGPNGIGPPTVSVTILESPLLSPLPFATADAIRAGFSQAMSRMYRAEVPQYGMLMGLVADINARVLAQDAALKDRLARSGERERIDLERHGAIRLGTAAELATIRRLFAVMGMVAVGYYDLSVAGIPVHSTAFRPIDDAALARNPFRVFTSLLRLDLIADADLRREAAAIVSRRRIFTPGALALIDTFEEQGGLTQAQAETLIAEALETFRWHGVATVDVSTYQRLSEAHRLIADIVAFKGPHINHLTPRTLDIDAAQAEMPKRGIAAKAVIEGPPKRRCPLLLRQTSFKALEEPVSFPTAQGVVNGAHTARFGEIEQRGLALTRKGRALYDALLARAHEQDGRGHDDSRVYEDRLAAAFADFPDDHGEIRRQGLGFYRYRLTEQGWRADRSERAGLSLARLMDAGYAEADPIVYEDFLPVSAAGIFQSNLGSDDRKTYVASANRVAFLEALQGPIQDEFALYEAAERRSIEAVTTAAASDAHAAAA